MPACMSACNAVWCRDSADRGGEVQVVSGVDLNRYLGRWYEIASIPTWFQEDCAGGTTAEYTLRDDGDIAVLNQCWTKDGTRKQARGRAWVVDEKTNAKLKVSFLPFGIKLFGGDYWIIDLDDDYEYAVVGHPNRKYGWILSRKPEMPEDVLKGVQKRLQDQGYDFSKFKMTDQKSYLEKVSG
jgi:apolipoprotein D and lipocalin family protein